MARRNDETYNYSFNGHQFLLKKKYISKDPRDIIDINYKWILGLQGKAMDCITIKTVGKEISQNELDTFQSRVRTQLPIFESKVFVEDVLNKISVLETR